MEKEDLFKKCIEHNVTMDNEVFLSYGMDENTQPFKEWLHAHLPSAVDREKVGADWISVSRPITQEWINYYQDIDLNGLMKSWELVLKSKRKIDFNKIMELAGNHHVTCGKWMFYAESGPKIDYLWEKVATGIVNGKSPIFHSAKVSTLDEDNQRHVVCIYNTDFRDIAQVLELEGAIRNLGVKCTMKYKPDVYTYLNVYVNNPWGLRPTIINTMFDVKTGSSVIKSSELQI